MTRVLGPDPGARTAAPPGMREQVIRAGLRRRRFAFAGAGSAAAVAVVAAAGLLAGGTAGSDSLRIDQPAAGASAPGTAAYVASNGTDAGTTGSTLPASRPGPAAAGGAQQAPGAAPAPSPQPAAGSGSGHGTHGPVTRTHHENRGICAGDAAMVGPGGVDTSSWCLSVGPPDRNGALTFTVCRNAKPADGAPLSFATAKEVDFAISSQGKAVWTWSKGRSFAAARHEIVVGYNECYDWTTRWDGRDEHGRPAPRGQLKLTAWSTARELDGRTVAATFTA